MIYLSRGRERNRDYDQKLTVDYRKGRGRQKNRALRNETGKGR